MQNQTIKFLSDGMLGKLTRWLRILGYDTEYTADIPDAELINRAEKSGRTLLTSDVQLHRIATKQRVESYLVNSHSEAENLAKFAKRFNLKLDIDLAATRCPLCNSPLREVPNEEVKGKVPPKSLKRYNKFWICQNPQCDKIYWQGSHWRKIGEILNEAKKYSF